MNGQRAFIDTRNPCGVLELTGSQPFPGSIEAFDRFEVAMERLGEWREQCGLPREIPDAERRAYWTLYRLGAYDQHLSEALVRAREVREGLDKPRVVGEVA